MLRFFKAFPFLIFICINYVFPDDITNQEAVIWSFNSGSGVISSLSVVDERLFFGNKSDNFYSLNALTGEPCWTFNSGLISNTFISSPFFAKGRIYIGAFEGKTLYCLEEMTGKELWSFKTAGEIDSSPRVFGKRVYFGDHSNIFYCLSSDKGEKIWDFNASGAISDGPLVINSRVFFGCDGGSFYCLDAQMGSKIWEFSAGADIYSSASFSAGKIYFGAMNGKFYCLDYISGQKCWEFTAGSGIVSSPAVSGGLIYFGSLDSNLYCLDSMTGKKIWEFKTGGNITSSPCVAGGIVYFGSFDRKFYCLDEATGNIIWELETGDILRSSPVIYGGKFYFGSDSGRIYCIDSGKSDLSGGNTLGGQEYYMPVSAEEANLALIQLTNGKASTATGIIETGNKTAGVTNEAQFILTNYVTNYIAITNYQSFAGTLGENSLPYHYTVQAGSFLSLENARRMYNRLKKMGYRVFLSEKKIRKSHYYRVRVGRYNSISDADSVIYRLRDEGFSPVLVKFVK